MNKLKLFLRSATIFISMIVFQSFVEATNGNGNPVSFTHNDMKILVLISSSDDQPIYPECEKIWRAYMHLDPDHVEAYFFKSNPDLDVECEIQGDIIWAQAETSGAPGGMQKTLRSMEHLLPRMHEFDYVIRTTVPSFIYFPRLFDFLESLPRTGCCSADKCTLEVTFPAGWFIIFSPDLVELLVEKKKELWNFTCPDDHLIGFFLATHNIPIIHVPSCLIGDKNS